MTTTSLPAVTAFTQPDHTDEPIAPARLFSIGQLGVTTFLAVPAGLALMGINYRRIGRSQQAIAAWACAPVATVILVMIGMALPEGTPTFLIPLLIAFGVKKVAIKDFGPHLEAMETKGGKKESGWTVFGAIVIGIVAALAVAIAMMLVFPGA